MTTHISMTNTEKTWIKTENSLLNDYIEKGIPKGKIGIIVGKSRQVGKSMYISKMMSEWKKANRQMKLKRIFDIIDNNL